MPVTYQTGSLAASLKLIAVSQRHGRVIERGLSWALEREDQPSEVLHSVDPKPEFSVHAGLYKVLLRFSDHEVSVSGLELEQNAERQEIIYIPDNEYDPAADYYVDDQEFDAFNNHSRRLLEREGQREIAVADGPIKDPYAKQGQGESLQAHPLLKDSVQFDGADANVTPTSDNEQALNKTLELQQELQAKPSLPHHDGPRPGGM